MRAGERDAAARRVASRALEPFMARARALRRARPARLRLVLPQGRLPQHRHRLHRRRRRQPAPPARRAARRRCAPPGGCPTELPLEPFKGHAYVVRRQAPRRLAGARFCLDRRRGRARPRSVAARASGPPSGAAGSPPRRSTALLRAGRAARRLRARRSWRATARASPAGSGGSSRGFPTRWRGSRCAWSCGSERGAAAHRVRFHLRHAGGGVMSSASQGARRPRRSRTTTTSPTSSTRCSSTR